MLIFNFILIEKYSENHKDELNFWDVSLYSSDVSFANKQMLLNVAELHLFDVAHQKS